MEKSLDELISEETSVRLKEMEAEDYQFPEKAGKIDAVLIGACICASLVLIVLCMTGVIA